MKKKELVMILVILAGFLQSSMQDHGFYFQNRLQK